VQGNLDPVYLLVGGTELTGRIGAILDALGDGPFVFNLGHGVLPGTPLGNVALLVKTVRAWRSRGEDATGR
jgi:uroporphyrinogen decarboxylase